MQALTVPRRLTWFVLSALSGAALFVGAASAPAQAPQAKKPVIPHAQDKEPNEPRDAQTAAKMMTVPEGFSVEVVASEPDIVNPVAMAIDERGRFWITESLEYPRREPGVGKDRVKVLEDTDGDGKCDKFSIFLDGLNIPSGVAVGHGGVWIANSPDILFVPDADRDGKPDGPAQVVVTGFGRTDTHELPNSLTWGPDGWLYGLNGVFNYSHVTYPKDSPWLKQVAGTLRVPSADSETDAQTKKSSSDDGNGTRSVPATVRTEFKFTCAMFRIHPRTREFQIFCEGTSNPWGIAFNDEGEAFVSACVIDHLWHLVETGYYHRQGGPYPPFTWKIDSIVKHKHQKAAYCGIHYFDSDAYPEKYRGKLYMGNIHGGCINVDRIERDGSTYKGFGEDDFLTANDAWFMPVVQKTGPDGCLYILDWYDRYHCYQDANRDPAGIDRLKGRLYRVRYNGKDAGKNATAANHPLGVRRFIAALPLSRSDSFSSSLRMTADSHSEGNEEKQRAAPPQRQSGDESPHSKLLPLVAGPGLVCEAPLGQIALATASQNADAPAAKPRVYPQIDLAKETDEQLIERLGAKNDFIRWTATRLLQERSTFDLVSKLLSVASDVKQPAMKRQSAFLAAIGQTVRGVSVYASQIEDVVVAAKDSPSFYRAWRTRVFYDDPLLRGAFSRDELPDAERKRPIYPPAVRLQQVIAESKLPTNERVIESLLWHLANSDGDRLIPQIVWQTLHPRLEEHDVAFFHMLQRGKYLNAKPVLDLVPRVTERLIARQKFEAEGIAVLFSLLRDEHPQVGKQVLEIIAAKVQSGELKNEKLDQLKAAMTEPLTPVLVEGSKHPLATDAALLAASWGDPRGLPQVRRSFVTRDMPVDARLKALGALVAAKDAGLLDSVAGVLDDKSEMADFKSQILTTAAKLEEVKVAEVVLSRFAKLEPELQPAVVELLTQRASWSKKLLAQVADRKIAAASINVNQARRMQALKDSELNDLLNRHWGQVRDTRNPDREKVVAEMKTLIRGRAASGEGRGDAFAGEKVFKRVCAACHKIYNEGPEIGPDITLNGRNDFNQLLSNVFDPSLVIGAGYRVCTVVTKNGRVLSGLLVEDSPQRVVLKPAAVPAATATPAANMPVTVTVGALVTIPRDEVEEFKLNELSLMPEGLEKQLQQQEIVDLFAFLTLDKHPSDKSAKRLPGVTAVTPRQSSSAADFPSLVAEILPGFSTKASGVDGVALLNNHFGRDSVLRTHPVSRDASCVLSQKLDVPADKKTKLILDVAHDPRGDWRLVVRGNGERLADEMISKETCREGWRTLTVDLSKFAGTEMKLDLHNQANDWSFEFGYWGGVRIISE